MLWTAVHGVIAHRFRLFATALAVTLGVAFTAGTLTFTDTIARTFNTLMGEVYAGTDAVVRGEEQFQGPMGTGGQRPRVDESLIDVVRQVDGVAAAEGSLFAYARIVGKDGTALGDPANGAPTIGLSWSEDQRINPLRVSSGRAPRSGGEVVIDRPSQRAGGLEPGDRTTIVTSTGPVEKTVVGTVGFGSAETIGGATMVAFHPSVSQALLAEPGKWDEISVVAEDGVSEDGLTTRLAAVLPDSVEAVTGSAITEENQDFAQQAMKPFSLFMNAFAVVALVVGAFMIYNTFSITVAQRTRENGLLRALGASRRQVLGSVMLEAVVVGVLASATGLFGGLAIATGLKALLDALGFGIPAGGLVFGTRTVVVSLAAGILVTLVAAVVPARQAARVAPMAAMSSYVVGSSGYGSVGRVVVGSAALLAGAATTLAGLFTSVGSRWTLVALGGLLVLVGTVLLARTIALPMSRLIGAPVVRLRGLTGELARENAMRNPRRTAVAGSALMLGVTVVVVLTTFVTSLKATVDEGIDRAFTGDLIVDSGASVNGGMDPSVATRLSALPEVAAATGLRLAPAEIDDEVLLLGAVDPETAFSVLDLQPLAGSPDALAAPDTIAVLDETAEEKGLALGSRVDVLFSTGPAQLKVAMVYGEELEANGPDGTYFLGNATYEAYGGLLTDWKVFVLAAPDTPVDEARDAVQDVVASYPGIDVMDEEEFAEAVKAPLDPMLSLSYALLGLAVVIALIGIGNTLALSIVERTTEIGLLRAVGMTREQLRGAVRLEAVIISVQGTLLGLALGVFLAWSMVTGLRDEGVDVFRTPWTTLLGVVVLAAMAGMFAAVLPSRRAAKLDILRAIHAH